MIFYISIFVICWSLSASEMYVTVRYRRKKNIIAIILVIFVFLSTFYSGGMGDYATYERIFHETNISHIFNINNNKFKYEYLYEFVSAIVSAVTNDYRALRFALAVICMCVLYRIIVDEYQGKGNDYSFTVLFAIWALNFGNIFIIRSTIATTICLYSIKYIRNRDLIKFLICTMCAILFHTMTLVWLVSYFIYKLNISRKVIAIGSILAIVFNQYVPLMIEKISYLFGPYIHTRVYSYVARGAGALYGQYYNTAFLFIKALANGVVIIIIFMFVLYLRSDKESISDTKGLFNIYLIGFFWQVCTLQTSSALSRVAAPFISVQFILFSQLFSLRYKSLIDRMIVHLFFSLYLLLRMVVSVKGGGYIPFLLRF